MSFPRYLLLVRPEAKADRVQCAVPVVELERNPMPWSISVTASDRHLGHELLASLTPPNVDLELAGIHIEMTGETSDDIGPNGGHGLGGELDVVLNQHLNQALLGDLCTLTRWCALLAPAPEQRIQKAHLTHLSIAYCHRLVTAHAQHPQEPA
jgi:hypothetical protein